MDPNFDRVEALTPRQREILRLISRHLQVKEVARHLRISTRTVKTHTDAARKRLGVPTSREAARLLMAYEESKKDIGPEGRGPSQPIDEPKGHGSVSPKNVTSSPDMAHKALLAGLEAFIRRLESLSHAQWFVLILLAATFLSLLAAGVAGVIALTLELIRNFRGQTG